jgi:hypothetical protein
VRLPSFTILNFYIRNGKNKSNKEEKVGMLSGDNMENKEWVYNHFPDTLCKKRWQEGCLFFYLLDNYNQPCSFAWFRKGHKHFVGEINKTVTFPFDVNCIFDCITPSQYRGKGYYPRLISWISAKESSRPSMIYANNSNIASNKGILKVGFKLTHKAYKFLKFVKISPINKEQINIYVQD